MDNKAMSKTDTELGELREKISERLNKIDDPEALKMIVACLSVMVKLEKCGTEEQNARLSAYLEDTEEKTPAEKGVRRSAKQKITRNASSGGKQNNDHIEKSMWSLFFYAVSRIRIDKS